MGGGPASSSSSSSKSANDFGSDVYNYGGISAGAPPVKSQKTILIVAGIVAATVIAGIFLLKKK